MVGAIAKNFISRKRFFGFGDVIVDMDIRTQNFEVFIVSLQDGI